jgi:hypothetical protein
MEEALENGKESSHSAHANGMIKWMNELKLLNCDIHCSHLQVKWGGRRQQYDTATLQCNCCVDRPNSLQCRLTLMCLGWYLTFWSLAFFLRTTRLNIQNFYMVLALRWVFCTDIRTDGDFCCINWLVFITVVERVYSAVRTSSLYKADYVSSFKG